MNNETLLKVLREKSQTEQKISLEVIDLIAKVEKRKLHLPLGYSSLFDFVTKDLGYEPSSAMRRIQAARLLNDIPEVRKKIADKSLSLSVCAQAQSFFYQQRRATGWKITRPSKIKILEKLENKSSREAEKELVKINPQLVKSRAKIREINEDLTELKIVLDKVTYDKLEELKSLLSHQNPGMSYSGLIELLVNKTHKIETRKRGLAKILDDATILPTSVVERTGLLQTTPAAEKAKPLQTTPAAEKAKPLQTTPAAEKIKPRVPSKLRRSIPVRVKQQVWQRDNGQCQYVDPRTQRKCKSKAFLEIDHIHRVRHGGENDPNNLRLLCRNHNQWRN